MKGTIDYKKLKLVNIEAARTMVLEYLSSNGGNVSDCAKTFNIQRVTVYNLIKKQQEGNLKDKSKLPRKIANKTPEHRVERILSLKRQTGFGAKNLTKLLAQEFNIKIPLGTVRGILRRNK